MRRAGLAIGLGLGLGGCASPPHPLTGPAPAPPAPRWVASGDGADLALAEIRGDKIEQIVRGTARGFGWLDDHVLFTIDGDDKTTTTAKYVDGKREVVRSIESPMPRTLRLAITRGGEAWLVRSSGGYLRIYPEPAVESDTAPPDLEPNRAVNGKDDGPWPVAAAGAAPAGVRVAIGKTAAADAGVTCESAGAHSAFPDDHTSAYDFHFAARTVRWLATTPPTYEVTGVFTNPAGYAGEPERVYFHPCRGERLTGYVWLGGDLWATFVPDTPVGNGETDPAKWELHAGDHSLGALHASGPLRANPTRP